MTSLKTSIKTITYLSDTGCLEIQGASLNCIFSIRTQNTSRDGGENPSINQFHFGNCLISSILIKHIR
ncbi:hypothetical protein D4A46_20310 [Escherichia coli]|nr:hypothetical protein [Escherichia coli]